MSTSRFVKKFGAWLILLAASGMTVPAHAGFQWVPSNSPYGSVPPGVSSDMPGNGAMGTMPSSGGGPTNLLPMESPAPSPVSAPVSLSSDKPISETSSMPTNLATATIEMPSIAMGSSSKSDTIVKGFATNVPLPIGLKQVVPPNVPYTLDADVDMGVLVTFKGGQGWRETLRVMLDSVGLAMREEGKGIAIGHLDTAVKPASARPMMMNPLPSSPKPALQPAMDKGSVKPSSTGAAGTMRYLQAPMSSSVTVFNNALPDAPSNMPMAMPMGGIGGDSWTAQQGDTLHKVLSDWCRRSHVEFQWLSEYDYPIAASVRLNGSFEDAVRGLLNGFESAQPQPVAELHTNSAVNQRVLIVQTRGNSASN